MTVETFERTYALDDIEIQRGGDGRTVEAYAAVFHTRAEIRDQHGHYWEEIARNAFKRTIDHGTHRVSVFYNHGHNLAGQPDGMLSVPIGRPLDIRADDKGLLTVTRYNDTPLADAVLESIKNGDIKGQSFRGRIVKSAKVREPGGRLPVVTRTELGLTEYGPTPFPAYAEAGIMAVRTEQIAASIAGLTRAERAELVRMLSSTPDVDPLDNEQDATPEAGPGTGDTLSHEHSDRRKAIMRSRARMAALTKGMVTNAPSPHRS